MYLHWYMQKYVSGLRGVLFFKRYCLLVWLIISFHGNYNYLLISSRGAYGGVPIRLNVVLSSEQNGCMVFALQLLELVRVFLN